MNQTKEYNIVPIGVVAGNSPSLRLEIRPEYAPALLGLSGFSHCQLIWWLHEFTDPHFRQTLQLKPPYAAPLSGVFATRSPIRPNPIGLSVVAIESVDVEAGIVEVSGLDAFPGSPVLDLKPYFPGTDRVRHVTVPSWASGWGDWVEE
jgi:tRNA-Thr(GGU) m(6)t(6)A37 methyltransferase TsaA